MVALVHRGEMIVPAGIAGQMRDGGGAGGAALAVHHQTHFNVTAMDARGVKQFLRDNGTAILGAINDGRSQGRASRLHPARKRVT